MLPAPAEKLLLRSWIPCDRGCLCCVPSLALEGRCRPLLPSSSLTQHSTVLCKHRVTHHLGQAPCCLHLWNLDSLHSCQQAPFQELHSCNPRATPSAPAEQAGLLGHHPTSLSLFPCPAALAAWANSLATAWAAWVAASAWEGPLASGSSAWEACQAWVLAWEAVAAVGEQGRLCTPLPTGPQSPLLTKHPACRLPRLQRPLPCMLCYRTEHRGAEADTVNVASCNSLQHKRACHQSIPEAVDTSCCLQEQATCL